MLQAAADAAASSLRSRPGERQVRTEDGWRMWQPIISTCHDLYRNRIRDSSRNDVLELEWNLGTNHGKSGFIFLFLIKFTRNFRASLLFLEGFFILDFPNKHPCNFVNIKNYYKFTSLQVLFDLVYII